MVIVEERLTLELQAEIQPLIEAHYLEIAMYKDIPLKVDWSVYWDAQMIGALAAFTVRDDGVLKGYAVYFVHPHGHYSGHLYAIQDVLYLDEALRGKLTGLKLIKYADNELRKKGVAVVMQHVKVEHDFGPMLKRIGYDEAEKVYTKRL